MYRDTRRRRLRPTTSRSVATHPRSLQVNRPPNRILALILVALAVIAIAGCGGSSPATVQKAGAAKAVSMLDSRIVIDVRTPAEYAAGHVAGAQNIDVEAGDFAAEDLDPRQGGLVSPLLPIRPQERDRSRGDGEGGLHRHRRRRRHGRPRGGRRAHRVGEHGRRPAGPGPSEEPGNAERATRSARCSRAVPSGTGCHRSSGTSRPSHPPTCCRAACHRGSARRRCWASPRSTAARPARRCTAGGRRGSACSGTRSRRLRPPPMRSGRTSPCRV